MKINYLFKYGIIIGLLLLYYLPVQAVIRYVKPVASGLGNASSWADASGSLTAILGVAQPGDEIWVAAGTYKPTTNTDRLFSFTLKNGVNMYGGFAGTESTITLRNVVANPTILSGDIDPNGENDSFHVILANQFGGADTILDGFTITGGRASSIDHISGGGMYITSLRPIIRNCTFTDNYAFQGGAIYFGPHAQISNLKPIDPIIENCQFFYNSAENSGGGIYSNLISNLTLKGCQFHENAASSGGGLFFLDVYETNISNSIFYNNTATGGGAMYLALSTTKVNNSVFWGNSGSLEAGAVAIRGSGDVFNHCTFAKNTAPTGSVFSMFSSNSSTTITNSIVWSDEAPTIAGSTTPSNISYSIVKGGYIGCVNCPGGNGDVDPKFYNISDLDGANDLLPSGDDGLRLTSNSPALNAGKSTTLLLDILGIERYPTGVANDYADLGAYEFALCTSALTRLYVNDDAQGDKSGSTWANALTDLRIAINMAKTCPNVNEIWVAQGIYKPTDTQDRGFSFNMQNNVAIYGGFAGTETLLSQRIWQKNPSVLSGDINPANEDDSYNVVYNFEKNSSAILDGFTITGGRATSTSGGQSGAGMYNSSSAPVIRNCVFKNNLAIANGGGMYNSSSDTNITNCVFAENSSDLGGGGLFNAINSGVTCFNSVFANNTSGGYGGGIINNGSNPIYINCTIASNNAALAGDGMQNTGADPAIINCVLFNNGTVGEANKEINNLLGAIPALSYSVVDGGYLGCINCPPNVTDPLFLDTSNPAGADGVYATEDDGLALSAVSPLVGQGLNSANLTSTDVAGKPRIQSVNINIGAYETGWFMSKNNGLWSNANNWNVGRVPGGNDYVSIRNTHQITIDIPNAHAHNVIVAPNAKLIIPAATTFGTYKLFLD